MATNTPFLCLLPSSGILVGAQRKELWDEWQTNQILCLKGPEELCQLSQVKAVSIVQRGNKHEPSASRLLGNWQESGFS